MKFRTFRIFACHFSISDIESRPKENVWNSTISLTSHNTSAAFKFLVVGNESPITTVLLLNYLYRCISEK
jgi:hypothetical protein